MKEVETERWNLQKGSDSLEPVVVDLRGQRKHAEARKVCEELCYLAGIFGKD